MKLENWRELETILLSFEDAWRTENSPSIDERLEAFSGENRLQLLAELVMIDFEHQIRRHRESDLDEYFSRYPELCQHQEIRDELLRHELTIRKKTGSFPDVSELESRFPNDTTIIALREKLVDRAEKSSHISSLLKPGTQVDGYRILELIGSGAFASVYSAIDTKLNRPTALKFLSRESDLRPETRLRMVREAQAVATLQHANIVPVFDTGRFGEHDYIASRLVEGVTLSELLRTNPPTVQQAVELTSELASALDVAHRAGIVHRDIKPANIMIEDGSPQLLDFGLAHFGNMSQQLTHAGDVVGTPAFMPPEQADGRAWQVDPRSDIYSLGAVLYRMVGGRLPFEGNTAQIITQVLHHEPTKPRELNPQVSRDLQTIILKCLQKETSQRYSSALELRDDLNRFLSGQPIMARPVGLVGRLAKWARRRPMVAALSVGVFILASFLLGVASQLMEVTVQRDRAQLAEFETQSLLAESAANAGLLAMQRGQHTEAISHFQQSLDRGYKEKTEILIRLVEANFVLRNLDTAADLLVRAEQSSRPELILWKGELALEGYSQFGDGESQFEQALLLPIPVDELEYAKGMLSDSSLEAVEQFRRTLEINPFHHRARRMLTLLLLSLARFDETSAELRIARQLYPENEDFLLLDCLTRSAQNKLQSAIQMIDASDLSEDDKSGWKSFCTATHETVNEADFELGIGQIDTVVLSGLVQRYRREFLPLVQRRKWRFPTRIGKSFVSFTEELESLLSSDSQSQANAMEKVLAIHPEGSLFMIEGAIRLSRASGSDKGDQQVTILEQSLAAYQQALQHPGFLVHSDQLMWKGVFISSMSLALIHRHDVQKNTMIYSQASRQINHTNVKESNQIRGFALAALMSNDMKEAERWILHWQTVPIAETDRKIDAIWHLSVLHRRQNDWLGVKKTCEQILELTPDHTGAKIRLNEAIDHLRTSLKASVPSIE